MSLDSSMPGWATSGFQSSLYCAYRLSIPWSQTYKSKLLQKEKRFEQGYDVISRTAMPGLMQWVLIKSEGSLPWALSVKMLKKKKKGKIKFCV